MKRMLPALLLLMLAAPAVAGPLEDGLEAYQRGDYATALREWLPLAEQGNAEAQRHLGDMYRSALGVTQDYAEAAKWYWKAAEQGEALAQHRLAEMYEIGEGVKEDRAEAAQWYRKAAEQGYARAQLVLGDLYSVGGGVAQDYAEAAKWYRKAAEQGEILAQVNLGDIYYKGEGVPQDYAEAAKWYRMAAEATYIASAESPPNSISVDFRNAQSKAQVILGNMYYDGQGVPQDYAEAMRWWRKVADEVYVRPTTVWGLLVDNGPQIATARNNLGVVYHMGQGVPQDYVEAAKWYRKAADQGYAPAQLNLGLMYDEGHGVPQDYVQAHKWYNLAAPGFPASEKEDHDAAVRFRDDVAKRMTAAEIAEAQKLAREWLAAFEKWKKN